MVEHQRGNLGYFSPVSGVIKKETHFEWIKVDANVAGNFEGFPLRGWCHNEPL